jgi:hypothetical protein
MDARVSPECRTPSAKLYAPGPLPNTALAVELKRPIRVLALGNFPSGGYGSGPGATKYTAVIQAELERVLTGVPIEVEARRMAGETVTGAPEYITNTVMEVRPDLVIWSAGTYDALARVEIDSFVRQVAETLEWLRSRQIDAVVVEPPYAAAVADDEHYSLLVKRLRETAERLRVPVVLRYEAMRYLASQQPSTAGQHFRLHDLSRRCTPEYVARAIDASLAPRQRTPADGGGAPR